MLMKTLRLIVVCSMITLGVSVAAAAQGTASNRTVLTFSQPVEVPGKVLPAGTYTFELHESQQNRHIIQIYDQAGTKLITTVLAVPSYRDKITEETYVKFSEVPAGQPQAMRIWFYPGKMTGDELVYSKTRARELAALSNSNVPAVVDTVYTEPTSNIDTMAKSEVVTLDATKEQPYKTPPPVNPTPTVVAPTPAPTPEPVPAPAPMREELPRTAGELPALALIGALLLAIGALLRLRPTRA